MRHSAKKSFDPYVFLRALGATVAVASAPLAAHAGEIVTFDWVPFTSSGTETTPSGSITLDLTSPSATPSVGGSSFSQSYGSSATWAAALTGFSFTASDGHTIGLANVGSIVPGTGFGNTWAASADVAAPFVPSATGNFLIDDFTLSGSESGMTFMLQFGVGNSPGTTTEPGLANNSLTPSDGSANTDFGYWELAKVTPVPLPAGLPLLVGGLGLFSTVLRRKRSLTPA
jgi:hypothetical protein